MDVNVDVVASSEDENFSYIPEFKFSDDADYAYICSNNTIYGTQYKAMPKTKSPLVVDASSDFSLDRLILAVSACFTAALRKTQAQVA